MVADAVSRIGEIDLLLIGGDLTNAGTPEQVEDAIAGWQELVPRVLAVAGNMDSAAIDERLADLGVSLNGAGVMVDQLGFFGVSAAPRSPLRTPYEVDEAELARQIELGWPTVAAASVRIFCPHAPPRETACDRLSSGQHVGSAAVRAFVEREQPDLVLCGHIHESRGMDMIGQSRIVNPGPAATGHFAMVDTEPELVVRLDDEFR